VLRTAYFSLILTCSLFGANLHFSLIKKESSVKGPTILVIGGIHGDEPGGYFAPELFLRKYTISSGSVWVVPNLNFDSIVANKRGIYGDMNRKFSDISPKDKDFSVVTDIKKLMQEPNIDLILNLHDGHGFYRQKRINGLLNPGAWGQACIIDQKLIKEAGKFGNLDEIAKRVSKCASVSLIEDVHEFNVKNTETKDKDKEMQKSLTYFAVRNGKPAFAVETSKNITDTATKVFYQLKALEEFMNVVGIKYKRDFELSVETISKLLGEAGEARFEGANAVLPLDDIREKINFFPVDEKKIAVTSKNPLVAVVGGKGVYSIFCGNKKLTNLQVSQSEIDKSITEVQFDIDGKTQTVKLGQVINIAEKFSVHKIDGIRVNIIGFSKAGVDNEVEMTVARTLFDKRFSVDKHEKMYRVEFYKGRAFCGNVVVRFN
jgi:Carboxypeptidase controlling helical cell shape catalytic/C-terminal domain of metallo-carboxypeptidase